MFINMTNIGSKKKGVLTRVSIRKNKSVNHDCYIKAIKNYMSNGKEDFIINFEESKTHYKFQIKKTIDSAELFIKKINRYYNNLLIEEHIYG